jgi:hypothetical protein
LPSSGSGVCRRAQAILDKVQFIKSFPIQVKKVRPGFRMLARGAVDWKNPWDGRPRGDVTRRIERPYSSIACLPFIGRLAGFGLFPCISLSSNVF